MPKAATRLDIGALVDRLADEPVHDDTDSRILAASAQLLLGEGLAGLEVDHVADRSGVGRSTIYRRYGDRNSLIAATLAHEGRRFLTVLADAVDPEEPLAEQVVTAFCAGLRLARAGGLADLVRREPLLLQLLTVDGSTLVGAARDHLVALGRRRDPAIDERAAVGTAEILVRLAVSFVLSPGAAFDLDEPDGDRLLRRQLLALVGGAPGR